MRPAPLLLVTPEPLSLNPKPSHLTPLPSPLPLPTKRKITVVGGGYIAVEFSGIFNRFGAETHTVYRQPLPLRGFDEEVRHQLGLLDVDSAGMWFQRSGSGGEGRKEQAIFPAARVLRQSGMVPEVWGCGRLDGWGDKQRYSPCPFLATDIISPAHPVAAPTSPLDCSAASSWLSSTPRRA